MSPPAFRADRTQAARVQRSWLSFSRAFPLVFLNDRLGVGRHHSGRFRPGFDLVLQLSQFCLRKILQLSMEEFFRITPLGEVKCAPFIGILKDEPLASLHGFIVSLSFDHASSVSYPPFQHQ